MNKILCDKCGHTAKEHSNYIGCMHERGEKICGCFLTDMQVREKHYKKVIRQLKAKLLAKGKK